MSDAQPTSETKLDGADRHPLHTDDELMRRWLRAQPKAKRWGEYLWAKVSRAFCVGSTSAQDICKRHGFDPDLKVKKRNHE